MLNELLIKNQKYDAQYNGGLSNHMSMSLIALAKVRATDQQLEDFFYKNCKKLENISELKKHHIDDENLMKYLGIHTSYSDLVIFFTEKLNQLGFSDMLKKYLVPLLPGVAAGAFHGLLRLAYGLFIHDESPKIAESEVVRGLAYWADSYLSLGLVDNYQSTSTLSTVIEELDYKVLQQVREDMVKGGYHTHLIFQQMMFAAKQSQFDSLTKRIEYSNDNLGFMANFTLRLYYKTLNFSALHTVTAMHAFRAILPFCEKKDEAINYFWRALFATYLTIGAPYVDLNNSVSMNDVEWMREKIIDAARVGTDDHVIKFVYTCLEEYENYNEKLYIKVAAIKLGLFQ